MRRREQEFRDARKCSILAAERHDRSLVQALFDEALVALEIAEGKAIGRRSPVAVAKALHLLAPDLFPLWDEKIAQAYGCQYRSAPALAYRRFMQSQRSVVSARRATLTKLGGDKSVLKTLDEYNYARFTKGWV